MGKVYEWTMGLVDADPEDEDDMDALNAEGWEYVSGPAWDAAWNRFACLMRREVVSGRVTSPPAREHVTGTEDGLGEQSDPLRNCWSCVHSSADARSCSSPTIGIGIGDWILKACGYNGACPRDADGCPGWAPKATP